TNTTLDGNVGDGLDVSANPGVTGSFGGGSAITNNGGYGVSLTGEMLPGFESGSVTYTGNGNSNAVLITTGTIGQSVTPGRAHPYDVRSLDVCSCSTLTVPAGARMRFDGATAGLTVSGTLIVSGVPGNH